jgi:uncharacterized FlaG/YvyC family protein
LNIPAREKKEKHNPHNSPGKEPDTSRSSQETPVKEYQVKQNANIVGRKKEKRSNSAASSVMNSANGNLTARHYISVNEELNNIVDSILEDSEIVSTFDQRQDVILSFVENIQNIPSEYSDQVFKAIRDRIGMFADTMIQQPKEFWKLVNIMSTGFQVAPHTSPNFKELVSIFQQLGEALLQKDIKTTVRSVFMKLIFLSGNCSMNMD